ncbi:MAG: PAS domain S-box protein [Spirochaetes bacterium]|nr:PAS domain S-box protein [Spirochaetota bacterium]
MGNQRILIVEDDMVAGVYFQQMLVEQGFDVAGPASSVEEMMASIADARPDLIIIDIILSGVKDGIEAARFIAERHDIPFIYLTSHTDPDTIARAKATGPYGFLLKPVNPSELAVAIEFAIYRHGMEKELRERERKYRLLADNMLDMVGMCDPWGIFTYVSPSYAAVLGYPEEELLGRPLYAIIHPEDLPAIRDIATRSADDDASGIAAYRVIHRDGRVLWFESKWKVLTGEDGRTLAAVFSMRDITDFKRIERALLESEEKFRYLFELSADAQLLVDGGRIIDCNSAAVNLFGAVSKEQILEKRPHELSPDIQPDGMSAESKMDEILKFAYELESISFEWMHLSLDGRQVPVDTTFTVIPIAGKRIIHAVVKDITLRKLALEALRRSEEGYRVLVETMSDGLVQGDEGGFVSFVNDRFCEMVEFSKNEIFGKSILDFIHEDDRENFQEHLCGTKRMGRGGQQIALKSRSGGKIDTIVSPRSLSDDRSRPNGIVAVFTDISDLRRLERQVLETSMKEQQRIGRDLHDDLGQILTGTGFLCESLVRKLANKSLPEAEDARGVFSLINEAKEHTRLLSRGLSPVEIDSGGIVAALERFARTIEGVYSVSCELRCDPGLAINDSMVETQFHYIVQESVTNAVRHGGARQVHIDLGKNKGQIRLSITDDGTGIPADVDPHKGMGLRTMRYRANAIGASITIAKNRGKGTAVTCVLRAPAVPFDKKY